MMLTRGQILMLHQELIEAHGGSAGIREESLLDSAIASPYQMFGGQELYPTIEQKAVRLGYGLIMNHPFIDGNKRIGTHTMLVVLEMNGISLSYTQKELYEIILSVAAGNTTLDELLAWVINHRITRSASI